MEAREAGLEQQSAAQWRRPGRLRHVVREIVIAGPGFRSACIGAEDTTLADPALPRCAARIAVSLQRRPRTALLVLGIELDPVLLRHLTREPDVPDVPAVGIARLERRIGGKVPMRGIARVRVRLDAVLDRLIAPLSDAAEEPEAIFLDRPSDAAAPVPVLAERRRLTDAHRLQLVVDVVGGGPVARRAVERAAAEPVAAGLRHHVDAGASRFGFAEAA